MWDEEDHLGENSNFSFVLFKHIIILCIKHFSTLYCLCTERSGVKRCIFDFGKWLTCLINSCIEEFQRQRPKKTLVKKWAQNDRSSKSPWLHLLFVFLPYWARSRQVLFFIWMSSLFRFYWLECCMPFFLFMSTKG